MVVTMLLLLLLLLFFLFIFLFKIILNSNNGTSRLPPGPKGFPFIGNFLGFDITYPHIYLHELAKKHGPLMFIRFGCRSIVVVSSAEVAKSCFKANDLALSGRIVGVALKLMSYNRLDITFSSYSDYWREMRKLSLLHLFSVKQVVSFRPVREDEVSIMIKAIRRSKESVNLSRAALFLANSIICRVGFGRRYDETGERFVKILKEAQEVAVGFFLGDYFPAFGWIDRLTGMMSRLGKIDKELDNFYQELIDDHLHPNRPESMNGDILDLLIKLREEQSASFPIDWDNIKAVLMDIFIAGTDTSGTLIIWTMTSLIKCPNAMKKAQKEVRDSVGNKGKVDEDDIRKLPYLRAVIKESMRLFPPIPLSIPRETIEKCNIQGYEIPPKTQVLLNLHAIGRDSEYWENPSEFFPERFIDSKIDFRGHDYGLLPFGSGRRGCPGINLGMATVELALANLLYSFDWELPEGMKVEDIDMDILPGITMIKKNDLFLVAEFYYQ